MLEQKGELEERSRGITILIVCWRKVRILKKEKEEDILVIAYLSVYLTYICIHVHIYKFIYTYKFHDRKINDAFLDIVTLVPVSLHEDTCNNIRERSMEVDRFAPIPMLLPQTTYHTYVYQLGHHHSEITTTICHRLPLPTTTFLHYLPPPTATYHYRYHSWRHLRDLRATFMNETHVRSTWPFLSKS